MKVAWFGHAAGAKRDGIVTYSRETVRGLLDRECQVLFFYHAAREKLVMPPPNVHAIRIGALDILNRATVSSLRAERTIRHTFERERPDVAHVSLSFSNLDGALPDLCHDFGVPIVATLHEIRRRHCFFAHPARHVGRVWRSGRPDSRHSERG